MLELCGFCASNYYNKVKLALLEKGIDFQETHVYPSSAEAFLAESPMGKVPYLRCPQGTVSESQALLEYLDEAFPDRPLYPLDSFERAKCRELIHVLELYLELPARQLYPAAFFGGTASNELKREVQNKIAKGVRALTRLLRVGPYIRGDQLTYADCAAFAHLPLISSTCKTMFGEDPVGTVPGLHEYLGALGLRPHAQRVNAERKAGLEAFVAYRAKLKAAADAASVRAG
ncbi:MAG TPA: glutathione S-transferase [Burkholderiales bacterium]|nr:glutathione S-transferase [Burkholderiales bacterium]